MSFNTKANYMPRFPVPEGEDETSWFVKEVERGLHRRYPNGIPDAARKQAQYETEVIIQMGFPGYFLVVADFINWAKDQGIASAPAVGRPQARWRRTSWASPSSTRWSTG